MVQQLIIRRELNGNLALGLDLKFTFYLSFFSQTNLEIVFHFGNLEDVVVLQNVAVLHRGLPSVAPQDVVKFFGTRVEN